MSVLAHTRHMCAWWPPCSSQGPGEYKASANCWAVPGTGQTRASLRPGQVAEVMVRRGEPGSTGGKLSAAKWGGDVTKRNRVCLVGTDIMWDLSCAQAAALADGTWTGSPSQRCCMPSDWSTVSSMPMLAAFACRKWTARVHATTQWSGAQVRTLMLGGVLLCLCSSMEPQLKGRSLPPLSVSQASLRAGYIMRCPS